MIYICFRNFRRRYGCYTISGNLPRDEEKNPRRSEEDKLSSASVPTLVSYISTSPAVTPTSPLEPGTTFGNARPFSYTTDLYRSVSYTNNSFNPDSEPVLLIAVPEPIWDTYDLLLPLHGVHGVDFGPYTLSTPTAIPTIYAESIRIYQKRPDIRGSELDWIVVY